MSKEPWQLTAAEALPLLRSGEMKAVNLAQSLLYRIQQRDNDVKAWVFLSPNLILRNAQRLDDLPASERGSLHGLPIGVKDIILTKDMPTQYNSRLYESNTPIDMDASCVMTLRAAGALIFGKTTTTEFATTKQGNWHQNLTKNAHDPQRTPGGSSSGSGAAVGDFQVPVALGTQTGGSIIRPASFNGCYGLKPTWGAISKEGIAQWCMTLDTCGFFTRSAQDLDILLDVFKIRDDDPLPEEPFKLAGARVGFCKTDNWSKAGPGTQRAMEDAKAILKKHGVEVEDVESPSGFDKVLEWHAVVLKAEGRSSFLGHYMTDRSKLHDDIAGYVEDRDSTSRKAQLEAYDNCARLRTAWDELACKYDVILTPSIVDEPPEGYNTGDMSFCSTWTIMHCPALNMPGFAGDNGLPVGLTAVAPRFRDRHLLHVAKTVGPIFEREGGWKRKNTDVTIPRPPRRQSTGLRST